MGRIGNEILEVKGLTCWVKYVKCQVTVSSFTNKSYSSSMFDSQAKLLFRVDTKPHHPDRVSTQFTDFTTFKRSVIKRWLTLGQIPGPFPLNLSVECLNWSHWYGCISSKTKIQKLIGNCSWNFFCMVMKIFSNNRNNIHEKLCVWFAENKCICHVTQVQS